MRYPLKVEYVLTDPLMPWRVEWSDEAFSGYSDDAFKALPWPQSDQEDGLRAMVRQEVHRAFGELAAAFKAAV
jgi:hypothetical protein